MVVVVSMMLTVMVMAIMTIAFPICPRFFHIFLQVCRTENHRVSAGAGAEEQGGGGAGGGEDQAGTCHLQC